MSAPYCEFLSSVVVSNVAKCLRMFMVIIIIIIIIIIILDDGNVDGFIL